MLDFDQMALALEESPNHKVLRRLQPELFLAPDDGTPTKTGIFLDVETTGLDHKNDEVIELAMVKFDYAPDGRIFKVGDTFQAYREPSIAIDPKITALTGITQEKVRGEEIRGEEVSAFIAGAAFVIAHNATFDRPFAETISSQFAMKPWGCSQSQVDWAADGFGSSKLEYLGHCLGFFYDPHRATQDCLAGIAILSTRLPWTGLMPLAQLRTKALTPTWRVWAEESPFSAKDVLKTRGYRWNGDGNGLPKAWYADVEGDATAEIQWLRQEIYGRPVSLRAQKITAFERFSGRPLLFDEEAA